MSPQSEAVSVTPSGREGLRCRFALLLLLVLKLVMPMTVRTMRALGTSRNGPVVAGQEASDKIGRPSLGCGQAVRRLILDQEIEGSNPSAPAIPPGACARLPA